MTKNMSLFFSVILHPLLMPLAGISILLFSGSYISFIPLQSKKIILLLFATGTLFLPLLMIPVFLFRKLISGIYLDERNERLIPYALTFIFYLFTFIMLLRIPVYHYMYSYMLGCLVSVGALFFINFRWKISAHMAGLGGFTAFIIITSIKMEINLLVYLILGIAASGIVATSRLTLSAHTPSEIYAGCLLGFGSMICCLILY
jgi:membrane-associated phospholipid phosphatase